MIKSSSISLMGYRDFLTESHIVFRVLRGCGFLAWFVEAPYADITPKKYISVISRNAELFLEIKTLANGQ